MSRPVRRAPTQPDDARSKKCRVIALAMAFAVPAFGDDTAPNTDEYTLWNPTPDADMRSFNTDRPPKANSPYTVDAGHFQYETDIAVFSYGDSGGVRTRQWTLLDPTLKLGLTNRIDAELQVTPYESSVTRSAANATSVSGVGDTFARLKVNVLGDDRGALLGEDRVAADMIEVPVGIYQLLDGGRINASQSLRHSRACGDDFRINEQLSIRAGKYRDISPGTQQSRDIPAKRLYGNLRYGGLFESV